MVRRTNAGDSGETDAKLHVERERSNDELLARSTALGEDADVVIRRAREQAAAVLDLARRRENASLADTGISAKMANERALADDALAVEQRVADAALDDERSRRLHALIQLLATERGATDHALESERLMFAETLSARDDLLAGVQHDTRALLNILMMSSSVITMRSSDPEIVKLANRMLRATAQVDALFADLLDVALMERGKLVLQPEPADLVALVRDALEINALAAEAHSIRLAFDAPPSSVKVRLDARRMMRVLMNLLGNAIKFAPEQGHVAVSLKRVDGHVEVAVTDTGPGISPDQLDSIFERFHRTDPATRTPGYGLGLYIARGIVEAHGGRIWAANNPGDGATFSFALPITEP